MCYLVHLLECDVRPFTPASSQAWRRGNWLRVRPRLLAGGTGGLAGGPTNGDGPMGAQSKNFLKGWQEGPGRCHYSICMCCASRLIPGWEQARTIRPAPEVQHFAVDDDQCACTRLHRHKALLQDGRHVAVEAHRPVVCPQEAAVQASLVGPCGRGEGRVGGVGWGIECGRQMGAYRLAAPWETVHGMAWWLSKLHVAFP